MTSDPMGIDNNEDYNNIEKKIAFERLSQMHSNLLSHVDKLDTKISQFVALNGLILSFVFFRIPEAGNKYLL